MIRYYLFIEGLEFFMSVNKVPSIPHVRILYASPGQILYSLYWLVRALHGMRMAIHRQIFMGVLISDRNRSISIVQLYCPTKL